MWWSYFLWIFKTPIEEVSRKIVYVHIYFCLEIYNWSVSFLRSHISFIFFGIYILSAVVTADFHKSLNFFQFFFSISRNTQAFHSFDVVNQYSSFDIAIKIKIPSPSHDFSCNSARSGDINCGIKLLRALHLLYLGIMQIQEGNYCHHLPRVYTIF